MIKLLFLFGFVLVAKAFVDKYLKTPLFDFWLRKYENHMDDFTDYLFSVTTSSIVGVIALVVYILSQSMRKHHKAASAAEETSQNSQPASLEESSKNLATLMKKRRSIYPKDFTAELIPDEEIKHILECANTAPTHGKHEPWRFVVYRRESIPELFNFMRKWYKTHESVAFAGVSDAEKQKAYGLMESKFEENAKASHIILICMKRCAEEKNVYPEWEEVAAVACAVQNIYLQATAKNLGGFWSSMTFAKHARDSQEMRDYVNLKHKEDRVLGGFVIGNVEDLSRFTRIPGDYKQKLQFK